MPLKCCVPNCCSNYKSSDCKISAYKYPREVSTGSYKSASKELLHGTKHKIAVGFFLIVSQLM